MSVKKINFLPFSPLIILGAIVLSISLLNFRPGTFLTGWDNLHPELNFGLNLKRLFFSVWQEYQGLGLLPGMGHAADLFREALLSVFAWFLPVSFLRYLFHFLMLFIGPLGVYFFLKDFIFSQFDEEGRTAAGIVGAVFYLFNLATLQLFYVPYEAFSTHFAFLPWLFLVNFRYLEKPDRKTLAGLLLVNLLSVTQGYVATFFLVYWLALGLSFSVHLWQNRQDLKKILTVFSLIFLLNSFWLLPNLYFVFTNVQVTLQAKINLMSTEENYLRNQKYGDLKDVLLLKGFWFDNQEMVTQDGQPVLQMGDWVSHLRRPLINAIGYGLFAISLLGIFLAIRKKNPKALLFLPVLILGFTFLANDTPGFSFLAKLLYRLPLFSQIFRFPFTKFSILVAFCLSLYYALAFIYLRRKKGKKPLRITLFLFFFFLPMLFLFPVFQGKLFSPREKAQIPNEYFQLFEFFAREDGNTRIANFPQPSFWGWTFYRWPGEIYSGSGWLWYGLQQPILDRAFDVWGKENENYYWEITYALYSQKLEILEKLLEKYQIDWILIDGNVVASGGSRVTAVSDLEKMLETSVKVQLARKFGKIKVYRVNLENPGRDFVFLAKNLPAVNPSYSWTNLDEAYQEHGSYFSSNTQTAAFYYPFRSLFSGRETLAGDFIVEEREKEFVFKKDLPEWLAGYELSTPKLEGKELIWVDPSNLSQMKFLIPEIHNYGSKLEVVVPKVGGYFSAELKPGGEVVPAKDCSGSKEGRFQNELLVEKSGNFWRLSSAESGSCRAAFSLEQLPHRFGYLIGIDFRHIQGRDLLFWLENLSYRKADLELYLKGGGKAFLIQPPMEKDGLGYALHFDNVSLGRQPTINDLAQVTVNPIPYDFLTQIVFVAKEKPAPSVELTKVVVSHPNPTVYEVQVGAIEGGETLVLSQSFNPGWHAYVISGKQNVISKFLAPVLGKEIKNHVLVNNWENGWVLDGAVKGRSEQSKIYLIYLPQYLEYLGLGFLPITFFLVLLKAKNE